MNHEKKQSETVVANHSVHGTTGGAKRAAEAEQNNSTGALRMCGFGNERHCAAALP
jgi:hypothetical protein